jgi:hypothetical protein
MSKIKKISKKALINLLTECKGISGATFIGLDTITIPTLKGGKSNAMQGKIQKVSIGNSVMIFQNKKSNAYENMVRRRLEAEGKDEATFELKPRAWGERMPNCPIVVHTNKQGETNFYLEVIFVKAGCSYFLFEGKPIDKKNIIGLEDKEEGEQGGLENKVVIRSFKIDSIARITLNKSTRIVED